MSESLLEFICSRRVTRQFSDKAIPHEHLWSILKAARWAPVASNIRLHRYVCVTEAELIEQIRLVSPGIAGNTPAAIIAILVNRNLPAFDTIERNYYEYIDAGTAAQNMLLAAHALGIGACPVTLDSPRAVEKLLNSPPGWTIEMLVLFGYALPRSEKKSTKLGPRLSVEDLVQWGAFPASDHRGEHALEVCK